MTDEVLGNEVVSSQCFSGPEKQERFDILLTEQNFSSGAELCSLLVLGEPASIASQNEYNIILNLLITQQVTTAENPDTDRGFFIGLIDTDPVASEPTREVERFTWTDGAAFVFGNESGTFPWRQDQPNNLGAVVENCVEVMKETSFWNDVACSFEAKMICRSPCQEVATGAQGAMLVTGLGFFGSVLIMIFLIFHIRRHRTYDHTLDNAGIQILMPEDAVPERRRALSGLPMIDKNNRTKGLHFFSGVSSGTFSRSSITTRSSVRSNGTDVTKISVPLSSVPKVRSRLRPKLVPPEPVQSRQALYKQNVRKNSLDVSL